MNYTQAIAALSNGKYVWRTSWPDSWLSLILGKIYISTPPSPAQLYQPTQQDRDASDWAEGDRPPH